MGITFNSLVMSNSHQSTAVVLKDFGIDVSLTSTSCGWTRVRRTEQTTTAARAFDLYHSGKVEHVNDHTFKVKSQYRDRLPYQVHITKNGISYCTCPDWMNYSGDSVVPDPHFHCKHSIAARVWLRNDSNGNGSKITNDCGTETAKALQDKLNGNNGKGGNRHPSTDYQLDTSDPFQESEQLDIDQIEGRSNGDLVHVLSNGEYIVSYHGIMKLADKHGVTFIRHTVKSDAKRNGTVIVCARFGNNTRASGKPMNGSFTTAVELAKRNAARQLLPLGEIKALEKKAQLEAEFDWQKAKAKCLELVPEFKLSIIINDLVRDGKLRQAHPSDYNRKEWLMIHDAVKKDAETNGNDGDDGGDNTPSSSQDDDGDTRCEHFVRLPRTANKFAECQAVAKDFVRFQWLKSDMLKNGELSGDWTDGDFAKLKEACEIDASLFGRGIGEYWRIDIQPNANNPWRYDRRYRFWLLPMSKRCFACESTEGTMPDTMLKWGRYEIKASLCLECSRKASLAPREASLAHGTASTAQKVGKGTLEKDSLVQKFETFYNCEGVADPSELMEHTGEALRLRRVSPAGIPQTADEFVERCKQAEAEVVDDNSAEDVEDMPMNGCAEGFAGRDSTAGKRKLVMGKDRQIWLVETDLEKKAITFAEAGDIKGNSVLRLTQAIACGADIGVVEL